MSRIQTPESAQNIIAAIDDLKLPDILKNYQLQMNDANSFSSMRGGIKLAG